MTLPKGSLTVRDGCSYSRCWERMGKKKKKVPCASDNTFSWSFALLFKDAIFCDTVLKIANKILRAGGQ